IGNRKDKHKARLKWAIQKLGPGGFLAEYQADLAQVRAEGGRPLTLLPAPRQPVPREPLGTVAEPLPDFEAFARTNVRAQKQAGFSSVIVRLPTGDVNPAQFRALARLVVDYADGELRTTNEQNLVFRFVPSWQVPALHAELVAVGLGQAGAMTMADVLSC